MSHSGYNGTCCPPWKSTTPPNEWLSRSFSRETKGMYDVRLGHDRRKAGNKSITTERRRNYPLTWKKGGKCARSPNSWVYPISCASSCRPLRMQKSTSSRGENRGSSVYRSKVDE
ncbi:hypothetical protein HZU67_01700 [Apis mellifera carnica]|uniref:Uncharacterized protein LOC102654122 n=1 Tax=Apis mellifera TaxID=7460 RepID=A0A7M7LRV8_APIME|nr:uncharacterized protein LOC102654122 [Apis mellifera]KAG9436743.1 hypothetical protein HZU67_01700 [Apis mellifera carnica]|eukprot:XP_006565476.1 uncharacterized protein LOC102654122 [Apis mellifera]